MSETVQTKIRKKIPWIFPGIRIPKINFPEMTGRTFDIPTPTRNIILIAVYIALFWLIAGGVYLSIPDSNGRLPIPLGADQKGNPIWIYPSINDAFVIESFVAASIIFIGAMGFMVLYQSTKYMYNASYAQKLVAAGLIMSLFSFIILQYIVMNQKT